MIFIIILTLIVAKALPSLNTKISSIQIVRISSISLIFALILTLNTYNITSIGSGIGIYSGLFHITNISHMIEIFIYLISSLILIGWPQIQKLVTNTRVASATGEYTTVASVPLAVVID